MHLKCINFFKVLLLDTLLHIFFLKYSPSLSAHPTISNYLCLFLTLSSFSFFYYFFKLKDIRLQHCDGFCHTSTWIIRKYAYAPFLLKLPPTSLPISACRLSASALCSLPHTVNSHWLCTWHMVMYITQYYSLKSSCLLPPLLWPYACSLCLHLLCCPADRLISTIFLDFTYIR